jgi:tetratricopeptide (TPR) repeat protein
VKPLGIHLLFTALLSPLAVAAPALLDAKSAIQQIQAAAKSSNDSDDPSGFAVQIAAYEEQIKNQTPKEAATRWLELVQEWTESEPDQDANPYSGNDTFARVIDVIPSSTAWSFIQQNAAQTSTPDATNDPLIQLLAATLNNDEPARWAAFKELAETPKQAPTASGLGALLRQALFQDGGSYQMENTVAQLARALVAISSDPAEILAALNHQLAAATRGSSRYTNQFEIPDLVTIVGEEKATDFLKNALTKNVQLSVRGVRTKHLAQTLALAEINQLAVPQWQMVDGTENVDVALFTALAQKFTPDENDRHQYLDASRYFLFSLLAQGRLEEAKTFVQEVSPPEDQARLFRGVSTLGTTTQGPAIFEFLRAFLSENPDLPLWDEFITLAAEQRQTAVALELAKSSLKRKDLSPKLRLDVMSQVSKAALANDDVAAGIASLREQIALLNADKKADAQEVLNRGEKMASVGLLLNESTWVDEGLKVALTAQAAKSDTYGISSLIQLLMEAKRPAEAQAVGIANIEARVREAASNAYVDTDFADELTQLAGIYDELNQSANVLELLRDAPWWGKADLSEVISLTDYRNIPLGFMAARALLATGEREKGLAVLKLTIQQRSNHDASYALLVETEGEKALPFLEAQFAADRFEERPLIWKAYLQLKDQQLEAAEKTIRQAISIDPSDGEMGVNDRMRAYAVLADILEARGQTDDAALFRGAVKAVRLAEEADRYEDAGLLTQAVKRYEESLNYFADAYCIQSRLAIQLMALGEVEKAESHYLRAFELMPDSFGRMESHCFGCERAFNGQQAETLAERTFTKMLEKNPTKPQLHYLMGYLRMEQRRYADALPFFQKATELDPDYLNAWLKILNLNSQIRLPRPEFDAATFAILRLDPFSYHVRADLTKVSNVKKAWELLTALREANPQPKPENEIFPLVASAKALKELENRQEFYGLDHSYPQAGTIPAPNHMLSQHEVILPISELLIQIRQQ